MFKPNKATRIWNFKEPTSTMMFRVKTECSGWKDSQAESTFSDKVGGSSFTRHGYDQYKSQAISK